MLFLKWVNPLHKVIRFIYIEERISYTELLLKSCIKKKSFCKLRKLKIFNKSTIGPSQIVTSDLFSKKRGEIVAYDVSITEFIYY